MRQTRLGSSLVEGTPSLRFAKEFSFSFILTTVIWCCLFYVNRIVGPKVFTQAPFVTEDFWVTCACFALGGAIVSATSNAKVRENRTMAE
jgi:hypothetical protein